MFPNIGPTILAAPRKQQDRLRARDLAPWKGTRAACARWEEGFEGVRPRPGLPPEPARSSRRWRRTRTASLETRSPSNGRTAVSLGTEAGRPSQSSMNREARRASRPTFRDSRRT